MYTNQKTDFCSNLKNCTETFISAMDYFRNLKVYYDSALQADNSIADGDDLGNGITGANIKAIVTSLSAVETFLTSNYHYTNLNTVR